MEFSVCIRCAVLTLAVWLSTVDALMFHLTPNVRKCLKEEIHKDVLVTGEYELSDAPGQVANLKVSCSFPKIYVFFAHSYLCRYSLPSGCFGKIKISIIVFRRNLEK